MLRVMAIALSLAVALPVVLSSLSCNKAGPKSSPATLPLGTPVLTRAAALLGMTEADDLSSANQATFAQRKLVATPAKGATAISDAEVTVFQVDDRALGQGGNADESRAVRGAASPGGTSVAIESSPGAFDWAAAAEATLDAIAADVLHAVGQRPPPSPKGRIFIAIPTAKLPPGVIELGAGITFTVTGLSAGTDGTGPLLILATDDVAPSGCRAERNFVLHCANYQCTDVSGVTNDLGKICLGSDYCAGSPYIELAGSGLSECRSTGGSIGLDRTTLAIESVVTCDSVCLVDAPQCEAECQSAPECASPRTACPADPPDDAPGLCCGEGQTCFEGTAGGPSGEPVAARCYQCSGTTEPGKCRYCMNQRFEWEVTRGECKECAPMNQTGVPGDEANLPCLDEQP